MDWEHSILSHNIFLFKIIGLWPTDIQNNRTKAVYQCYGYLCGLCSLIVFMTEVLDLIFNDHNFETAIDGFIQTITTGSALVKILTMIVYSNKYYQLKENISEREREIKTSQKMYKVYSEFTQKARKISYIFWASMLLNLVLIFSAPFIEYNTSTKYFQIVNGTKIWSRERPLLLRSWLPLNQIEYYNFYYVFHAIAFLIGGSVYAAWDTLFITLMLYTCGLLKILTVKIAEITDYKDKKSLVHCNNVNHNGENCFSYKENDLTMRKVDEKLKECINDHCYIMRYVKEMNTAINPVMFSYSLTWAIALCAYVHLIERGLMKLQYLVLVIFQLFLFFWYGNKIIEMKSELLVASYNCKWYEQNVRFRKHLIIFRQGLMIPLHITIGHIYVMSLPTFLTIVKTSYSLFAVLKNVD